MEDKISRYGTGRVVGPYLIAYGLVTILLTWYFHPFFQIRILPYPYLLAIGSVSIAIGLPFWIISAAAVLRAYDSGKLVTTGAFRVCRHPVYASMMLLVAPGIALVSNSWMMLTAPLLGFALCKSLVRKEEAYLEKTFGTSYLDYKRKVPAFIPIGWLNQD